jgi:hypothetical protein
VDATAPTSAATSPQRSSSPGFTVSYTASDNNGGSGLATVDLYAKGPTDSGYTEVATDSTPSSSGSLSYTATEGDGSYSFYAIATDKAGNVQATPANADTTTLLDTTAPASHASSPQYAKSPRLKVSYGASDTGSGLAMVDLYAKGPSDSGYAKVATDTTPGSSGSFDYAAAKGDGAYSFYTIATDQAGNVQAAPANPETTTLLDTTPPSSQAQAPTTATSARFAVPYSASDSGSGLASVDLYAKGPADSGYTKVATDPTPSGSGSFNYTASEGDGAYSFYTIATDRAGNVQPAPATADSTTSLSVAGDTTAPTSSASSPQYSSSAGFTVSYIAADDPGGSGLATVDLYAKGPSDAGYTKAASITAPSGSGSFSYTATEGDGNYSFYTIATDQAGNTQATPNSSTTTLDTTPPTSTASAPQYATGSSFTVSYTAADSGSGLATVALYAKGPADSGYAKVATNTGSAGSGSFSFTAGEGDGSYSFYTIATDQAGNVPAAPANPDSTTQLDTSPPTSQATSPPYANSSFTVSYTAADSGSGRGRPLRRGPERQHVHQGRQRHRSDRLRVV